VNRFFSEKPFRPSKIIIHHSATEDGKILSLPSIRKYHKAQGFLDVGYHTIIEEVDLGYEALYGRPLCLPGAHTKGQNETSLGICLVGNFSILPPPHAQLLLAGRVVSQLCRVFNIPLTEIYPHSKFNATECPGIRFNMDEFISNYVRLAL
jgi:N-acetylmuramoyl-L-alanine amidase